MEMDLADNTTDVIGSVLAQLGGSGPSEVTGESGGGAVSVTMQGMQRVVSVRIAEAARDDSQMLEDLVAAAVNDALAKGRASAQRAAMGLFQQLSQE
jgi:hypothetical protein